MASYKVRGPVFLLVFWITAAFYPLGILAFGQDPAINGQFPIREKSNLGPPIVTPPIHECAMAVNVSGFVPKATIRIYANGSELVGTDKPKHSPADIKLTRALKLNDVITATQTVGAVTTDQSYDGVTVTKYPTITTPAVVPKIYECGRVVPVGNLVASTHVEVWDTTPSTAKLIGDMDVTGDWEPVVTKSLEAGHHIQSRQIACPATPSTVKSPFSSSVSVTSAPNPPPTPMVDKPVIGAEQIVVHNLLAGAEVDVEYGTGSYFSAGLATTADNTADVPPVPPGVSVTSIQRLCTPSAPSPPVTATNKPDTPLLGGPICAGSHYVMVDYTMPDAMVVLLRGGSVIGYGGGMLGTLKLPVGSGVNIADGDQLSVVQYFSSTYGTFFSDPSNTVTVGCDPGANVVTQHNNNQRTGVYSAETVLTPSAVLARGMRVKYIHKVEGWINAQPLYVRRVELPHGVANGLYVATIFSNKVYALNAETGDEEWVTQLKDSDPGRPLTAAIDSTPVIDVPNQRMYVVFSTKNQPVDMADQPDSTKPLDDGKSHTYQDTDLKDLDFAFWVVALDIRNGHELSRNLISASGYRTNGSTVSFEAMFQRQHPALLLDHGVLYVAFGSIAGSEGFLEYHGWVMAYRASDLAFQSSFNTSRDWQPPRHPYAFQNPYNPSGIWQGGGGLVADPDGNVYMLVGNGATDLANGNYGDTYLKLTPTGSSLIPTAFVPADAAAMAANDADLGGGGNLAIPGTDFVIGGGKPGFMYLMNRGSMDLRQQFTASTNQYDPSQRDQSWNHGPHLHGSPTYWRGPDRTFGNLYVWGEKDYLRLFHFDTATGRVMTPEFKKAPVLALVDTMPGGMISISSNGNRAGTGVLWATLPTDVTPNPYPGRLYAFNAETLQPLWDTDFPSFGHWLLPTIAEGKVFVGTSSDQIICYELGDEGGHNTSWKPYQPHDIASLAATVHSSLHPTEAVMTTIPQNTLLALSPPAGLLKFATLTGKGNVSFSAKPHQRGKTSHWQEAGIAIEGKVNADEKQGSENISLEVSSTLVFRASDGSTAETRAIRTFAAPEDGSAKWELYEVVRASGTGLLRDAAYIQRVDTQGGLPPMRRAGPKSPPTRVPFEAEYIFYRKTH